MNKMLFRLSFGYALVFGLLSCNRAAYMKLPASAAYPRTPSQPGAMPPPMALPQDAKPQRVNRPAHVASKTPLIQSLVTSPRPTNQTIRQVGLAHLPVAAIAKAGKRLQKARVATHRQNTASAHEANPYKGVWTIILIGLGLLILGGVGVFALGITWLQILAGVVAFIGLLLSFGLYFALS